jgi:eukaryotic-like serine/threonine-protein kinase
VAFSSDGRRLASSDADRTLRLRDAATGKELARFDGDSTFEAIEFAPDGKSLASCDSSGRVHLIDILVDEADKTAWLARQRH